MWSFPLKRGNIQRHKQMIVESKQRGEVPYHLDLANWELHVCASLGYVCGQWRETSPNDHSSPHRLMSKRATTDQFFSFDCL